MQKVDSRRIALAGLLAGGIAWLAKLAVIVDTDGRTTDSGAAAVFFLLGVALLALGFAALGWSLARRLHVVLRPVAAVAGAAVFFVGMNALDGVGKSLADETSYWHDEVGILLTAVAALAVALGSRRLTA